MDADSPDHAREALRRREKCKLQDIAVWLRGEENPSLIIGLDQWAESHSLDAVVWTSLPSKFGDEDGFTPSYVQVIGYLSSLTGTVRDAAERYVRYAPRQIVTAYRRRIEASLHWTALS